MVRLVSSMIINLRTEDRLEVVLEGSGNVLRGGE